MIIKNDIEKLTTFINLGKVACFKTDTIWGLSANPLNKTSLQALYSLKQRQIDKPFIFLISKNFNLKQVVKNISPLEQKLINNFWPGPLTIIFEAKENLPILSYYQNKQTIALRMPDDNTTQNILSKLNYPLPSTSVNLENNPPLNSFEEIYNNFYNENIVLFNSNEKTNENISSTIVKVEDNNIKILREGSIKKEKILSILT